MHGVRGVLVVGQAAALCLDGPLVAVAVAVEDDALVLVEDAADDVHGRCLNVLCLLEDVRVLLEGLGHRGVEHGVAAGEVDRRAGHAELEAVAGEGEGAGAVAVGCILGEMRQDVAAQVHELLGAGGGVLALGDGRADGLELVAQEDRDDGGRSLVGAQAMVVAGGGDGGAQELLVVVHSLEHGGQGQQEDGVVGRVLARREQVHVRRGDGPVVVLAAAVDACEGLLADQAVEAMVRGALAQDLHGEEVVVDGRGAAGEDRGDLVLGGGHLVVLGLGVDAELPELLVNFLHVVGDGLAHSAEVVLVELLALGGRRAEEGAAGEDEVRAGGVVVELDQEVLLLGAHGGNHLRDIVDAEAGKDALGLVADGLHGAQQRGLLVEGLAGVGDEGGGDAQDLVLDESVGGGVPSRVAAGRGGLAQATAGERGCVGLALDQLLAREGHDGGAVAHRVDEGVVLFRGAAGEGLEPVGVVGAAVLDRPLLHSMGDGVGDFLVEGRAVLDGLVEALVDGLGQALLHHLVVEDEAAVDLAGIFCHSRLPLLENDRVQLMRRIMPYEYGCYLTALLFPKCLTAQRPL